MHLFSIPLFALSVSVCLYCLSVSLPPFYTFLSESLCDSGSQEVWGGA